MTTTLEPTTNQAMLTHALVLAVIAPTEEQSQRALSAAQTIAADMTPEDVAAATAAAETALHDPDNDDDNTPGRVWKLSFEWDYDPDVDAYMRVAESLHDSEDGAMLSVFDAVHHTTGATPESTIVVRQFDRPDGGRFVYCDAAGEPVYYSLIPMTINRRAEENLPTRNYRIDPETNELAMARARQDGTTLSTLIRGWVTDYRLFAMARRGGHVDDYGTDYATAGVTITTTTWARWPEVANYARHHGISEAEAVISLANSGLSHERRTYL